MLMMVEPFLASYLFGFNRVNPQTLHQSEDLFIWFLVSRRRVRRTAGRVSCHRRYGVGLRCHPPVLLDLVYCVPLHWLQD